MIINVHAGHNPDGKAGSGAVGLLKESTQTRRVKRYVVKYLKAAGQIVYDCTCNNGVNQADVLEKIVAKCNAHDVDIDIAIHFNSGAADKKGDGNTTGTECYVYDKNPEIVKTAENVCKEISKLGFRNRGVKQRPELYVLNATKAPAILIECCFVDDKDDVKLYHAKKMAKAIVMGILNADSFKVKSVKNGVYLRVKPGKNVEKTGRMEKGTVCNISKVQFVGGILYGYVKKYKSWISLVHTTHVS